MKSLRKRGQNTELVSNTLRVIYNAGVFTLDGPKDNEMVSINTDEFKQYFCEPFPVEDPIKEKESVDDESQLKEYGLDELTVTNEYSEPAVNHEIESILNKKEYIEREPTLEESGQYLFEQKVYKFYQGVHTATYDSIREAFTANETIIKHKYF